jgi:hypothetical protein
MNGIKFISDEKGKKDAVIIDLKKHSELWEDIYDSLIASERVKEPSESYENVKAKVRQKQNEKL